MNLSSAARSFLLALPTLAKRKRTFGGWLSLAVAFGAPSVGAGLLLVLAASRDPLLSWGDVHDARSFVSLVGRSDYGGLFSAVHGATQGTGTERVVALGGLLAGGFGAVTLLVAALGAGAGWLSLEFLSFSTSLLLRGGGRLES